MSLRPTVVLLLVAVAGPVFAQGIDFDGDGYTALPQGTDCFDTFFSAYKNSSPTCRESNPPTEWAIPNIPYDPSFPGEFSEPAAVDHTLIQDPVSGEWHFYSQSWTYNSAGLYPEVIRHLKVAPDFLSLTLPVPGATWADVNVVRPGGSGAFDSSGLWAPFVVHEPFSGKQLMYFSGVTNYDPPGPRTRANKIERIGVAESDGFYVWRKRPGVCPGTSGDGCVLDCRAPWTRWDSSTIGNYEDSCRDPFVIRDPGDPNKWYLLATAVLNTAIPGGGGDAAKCGPYFPEVIHVAVSTDNQQTWSSLGYIRGTAKTPASLGGVGAQLEGCSAENPTITYFGDQYGGTYRLYFKDFTDPSLPGESVPRQTQYLESPTLSFDASGSANWHYQGYIETPNEGINAPEITVVKGDTWILSFADHVPYPSGPVSNKIRLKRMYLTSLDPVKPVTYGNLTNLICRISSKEINPGRPELCQDGVDNNCNFTTDENCGGSGCRGCQFD